MYEILFTQAAVKQMKKLEKPINKRTIESLERICTRPGNFVKKMLGLPYYRIRVGDYTIILDVKKK